MKKILYTLFVMSLLATACTKEVPVFRGHDINAEVGELTTAMEMKTIYCNLNESEAIDLQALSVYLTEQSADVAMFVAPVKIGEVDFKTWLEEYALENNELAEEENEKLTVCEVRNGEEGLSMAALVKNQWPVETYAVNQGTLPHAVLHFEVNNIHFVVTEMPEAAKNTIPEDWNAQVNAMTKNKETVPLVYTPDNLAIRDGELLKILQQTSDSTEFLSDVNWIFGVNMKVASYRDLVKYDMEFLREDYYDGVTYEFLTKKTAYYSVSEYLDAEDPYFGLSLMMTRYGLIECNAVHHSVYTPSTVDGTRFNSLYATAKCWNMFESFDFDTAVAEELGVKHYPIIVTLKSEE